MKIIAILLLLSGYIQAIPIYEFFKKGDKAYYQANSKNIADFFKNKLQWPASPYLELFEACRARYDSFGLPLNESISMTLFQVKVDLDESAEQRVDYYCLINEPIAKKIGKLKKIKLERDRYYYFQWDIGKSELTVFSIILEQPTRPVDKSLLEGVAELPLYLLNIETKSVIYFLKARERNEAVKLHPLIDIQYPILWDPHRNEYDFALIETNPQFFKGKTRNLFKEFNRIFGIIPDRLVLRDGQTKAVMP